MGVVSLNQLNVIGCIAHAKDPRLGPAADLIAPDNGGGGSLNHCDNRLVEGEGNGKGRNGGG